MRGMNRGSRAVDAVCKTPTEIFGSLTEVERKHAPSALYLAGDMSLLASAPRVSVVGSRQASPEGLRRSRSLAKALVDHGIVVVSGLAEGVDTAAHRGAIEAGGRTMAVLGTPLDQAYPKANAELQALIGREHLLVTQFAVGHPVQPKNFPLRNRTMALLTDATIIVEAGETSGTVHQGWEALRLGRLLFLLESVASDPQLSWPKEMIRYGAQVLSRESLAESLREIPVLTVYRGHDLRHIA